MLLIAVKPEYPLCKVSLFHVLQCSRFPFGVLGQVFVKIIA